MDKVDRHMERYFARLKAAQTVVEQTVVLRHPKTGYLHRAIYLETANKCDECGAGFSGISTSAAACRTILSGPPPYEGEKRQWFHGGFDIVNLVDEPNPKGKRCKKCFKGSDSPAPADTQSERR